MRLIDLEPVFAEQDTIDRDLIAGLEGHDVALHQLGRIDGLLLPVAQHVHLGAREERDAIELALGAHFLRHADARR